MSTQTQTQTRPLVSRTDYEAALIRLTVTQATIDHYIRQAAKNIKPGDLITYLGAACYQGLTKDRPYKVLTIPKHRRKSRSFHCYIYSDQGMRKSVDLKYFLI